MTDLVTIPQWLQAQEAASTPTHLLSLLSKIQKTSSNAWISLATPCQLTAEWNRITALKNEGHTLPLYGVPFAVKDNIDAAGFRTTAACPAFADAKGSEPEFTDSTVVARLKAQGAIVLGKTNLDQFATGLVGTRSPYGAVGNSINPEYVSGGSSSGSGAVVGLGLVPFSLGTDTAGSGRVPAGLNNVLGLKPTRGALSTTGVLPACRTLDCVSIFAQTVEDAELVLRVAEGFNSEDAYSRARGDGVGCVPRGIVVGQPSLAICKNPEWFGHTEHAAAYDVALKKAQRLGWRLEPVDFSLLFELANFLYEGPWVAERYAAIDEFVSSAPAEAMDPTVRKIIMMAKNFSAADLFKQQYRRQELIRKITSIFSRFDALLVPTSPTFPTIADLAEEPIKENSRLGTYTNFVNFMDWSAIAIPAGWRTDNLPFGITLIAGTWEEPRLLELSRRWLSEAPRRLGATDVEYHEPATPRCPLAASDSMKLAVVGAHLSGFPLNKDLVTRGATLAGTTTTSPCYQLYRLQSQSAVLKPGLKRVATGGCAIEVEVWDLPRAKFGSFLETVKAPLGIGSIELQDGQWVHGFICEPDGLEGATEITSYGGWRAYTQSLSAAKPKVNATEKKVIRKVLVANRGEIAARIIRTLHDMKIQAIAIYSTADAHTPHVSTADVALPLVGNTVADTYLNARQILDLACQAEADAVIPGYGFLAENADFAAAVEAAGIIWIGPTSDQMRELGLKHRAREIAIAAGVPVVPGSKGLVASLETALEEAEKIGYPVMVKSTAGGGGIGLYRCNNANELQEAFDGVRRLGQANFGDDGVFIEHFIEHARHIEVQVLGDGSGRVVCAGERDCSMQRRNQKVIEETPAAFVPLKARQAMRDAAVALTASVRYRNVGTVEFIFDIDSEQAYFLEMNTRLQVEHPVTEAGTGLDLVQCMVNIAMQDCSGLFAEQRNERTINGAAIEVRVYAESPLQEFRPSSGKLTAVEFPIDVRVDTWVKAGQELSSSYDPMLAKLIVHAADRRSAARKMSDALSKTIITGVETNLEYLKQIVDSEAFLSGNFTTKSLDTFPYTADVVEIVDPGSQIAVQDFPGRRGYWHIGVPPSGPMDNYSFQLANRLINNDAHAAGLECSVQGPTLLFHCSTVIAVVGAEAPVYVDGEEVKMGQPILIRAGQRLAIGTVINGARTYVAVKGGIQTPLVMGSRSTFVTGHLGGHNGRNLRIGDLLPLIPVNQSDNVDMAARAPSLPLPSSAAREWIVSVLPGPHGSPAHFTEAGLLKLFTGEWTVHYNSNRIGVRLSGPRAEWARETGGDAGLHPSNIHDSPYPVGGISFTGDEAVVLTADGPSLGGFVVFATVVEAELWKFGQMLPGDRLYLRPISLETAQALSQEWKQSIDTLTQLPLDFGRNNKPSWVENPVLREIREAGRRIVCRQAGDRALLLDFGHEDNFNLRQTFHILSFIEQHRIAPIPNVQELTPGVRSIHVQLEASFSLSHVLDSLVSHEVSLGLQLRSRLPSRVVQMPLAFDDEKSRKAITRYTSTIRSSAPYLPSNVEFLQRLNGLASPEQVGENLHTATFLVLGLGDVYQGSPCAVPLDPRHRLLGTKYNPSRSFTPRGAVGVAGQYLCIYATDSPGGYQLVGRTVPIWNEYRERERSSKLNSQNPWLFSLLDQITFYPVAEKILDAAEEQGTVSELVKITHTELDLEQYEQWLSDNGESIAAVRTERAEAVRKAEFFEELLKPYQPTNATSEARGGFHDTTGERVKAPFPGRCFRCAVEEGDQVEAGDTLIWIESNKMEVKISTPVSGKCVKLLVAEGDVVGPADDVAIIRQ
ncbi:putative Allophanate hydrolase [Aspergillus mulundensis]|uniref:Putative Allophanate hydrolase n=1 Tax=Aspergillus mulundensis TaxID=1810919 RepID=A0A3D8S4H2_9EURO|nr:putative Allophanate hydrolase [Aspergillus mulundensis]RDW81168.1 putative Allophanate hydrolase [Aspergillus mulundensis]